MGLGGPKKRVKFSQDPNNTWWSRSDTKYGQRILQSQGWQPGEFLGAKNAPHAKFHSAANSSHIKVALREDNLGLGARYGAAGGEWESTGLDGFQDLLGRLNGIAPKELEVKQQTRAALKRDRYVEKRWGSLHFVSGGLLVGDRIEEAKVAANDPQLSTQNSTSPVVVSEKQREIPTSETTQSPKSAGEMSEPKAVPSSSVDSRSKMSNMVLPKSMTEHMLDLNCNVDAARLARKSKRKLERKSKKIAIDVQSNPKSPSLIPPVPTVSMDAEIADSRIPDDKPTRMQSASLNGAMTCNARHAVRQRHIKHKKMAMMDHQALNEILMIKK